MASQYDIKPGISESISNQDIGSFALNQWQYIELDAYFPFLMSDIVLKQGTSVIPPSAYELAQDNDASAQEVGLTGKTLYGMIRVTNITYAGPTLNISGNNFGTYVSNQSVVNYIAAQIATKSAPGSDAFIEAGEKAVFESGSGLALISDNSGEIPLWNSGITYSAAGTLVRIEGKTHAATGQSGNLNRNPMLPENPLYWFTPPGADELEKLSRDGIFCRGGLHAVNNRAGANYQQNMLIDKKAYGGIQYNFHMIHLDGTTVTGDSTLEGILKVGLAGQYPYLDLIAPDVLGARVLLDVGEYVNTPMSLGGENDVLATLLEDRFQGHWHDNWGETDASATGGAFRVTGSANIIGIAGGVQNPTSDGTNGTPRTGLTTRPKEFTEGISYIIVKVAS